ncbi:MAG: RNA polymerase sigma factor (sigma-70 family) [Flavobacteriales bacterium]|jgi:RNA polymerase sigma factor (sigma-70 family)
MIRQYIKPIKGNIAVNSDTPATKPERQYDWSKLLSLVGENKNEDAFSKIFAHFAPLLKGFYASSMPANARGDCEELVQEVMCKVWFKSSSFDLNKSAASTWIFTIARNTRIDHIRKHAKQDNNTVELGADDIWDDSSDNQPFIYLDQARDRASVSQMLSDLPSEQRQCLHKVYMEGKSHSELASELALPLGTVKSRIRLGLQKLQSWRAQ